MISIEKKTGESGLLMTSFGFRCHEIAHSIAQHRNREPLTLTLGVESNVRRAKMLILLNVCVYCGVIFLNCSKLSASWIFYFCATLELGNSAASYGPGNFIFAQPWRLEMTSYFRNINGSESNC